MRGHWDPALTGLSVAVSVFTAFAALRIAERARDAPSSSARRHWLIVAAIVLGGGIWSKYAVGILAFDPEAPVSYAFAPMAASFLVSICFVGGGFAGLCAAKTLGWRLVSGFSLAIGLVVSQHLELAAVRLSPPRALDGNDVAFAVLVALAIAAAIAWFAPSIRFAARPRSLGGCVVGAIALGASICFMHWLGMRAIGLDGPLHFRPAHPAEGMLSRDVLATLVAAFTLTALGVAFALAAIDRRVTESLRSANEALEARVRERTVELERNAGALALARDAAVRAAKSKEQLLANMSHELRTPLNAILGFSEMMRGEFRGPLENSHYKRYADLIHSSGAHLLGLVNQLLDQSKIEAGRFELVAERVDLTELTAECVALVSPAAAKKQIAVWTDMAPSLVAEGTDAAAVRQVLLNLLSNAVKFTEWGGSVAVEARRADGMIEIAVADNGIGIPEDALERVLEPFQQADSSLSRKYGGAGLGLSISNRLMGLLGGSLGLKSEVGRGTTATMRLPVAAQNLSRAS